MLELFRRKSFTPTALFVDGISKSGKAAVAMAVSSLDRVEHIKNEYHIDRIVNNYSQGWLNRDAAIEDLITVTDFGLFNSFMGRDLNTNQNDWSSIVNSKNPELYYQRMATKDTPENASKIFKQIESEKPISAQIAEELIFNRDIFEEAFPSIMRTLIVMRHPIELIFNWEETGRGTRYGKEKRLIHPTFNFEEQPIPLEASEWPSLYINSKSIDRVFLVLESLIKRYLNEIENIKGENRSYLVIPFEDFITNTSSYLTDLESFLDSSATEMTSFMCERQRLPRKLDLKQIARKSKFIENNLSNIYLERFEKLCVDYERTTTNIIELKELRSLYSKVESINGSINRYE